MATKSISVRLDTKLVDYLYERAERENRTVSNTISTIINDAMNNDQITGKIVYTNGEWTGELSSHGTVSILCNGEFMYFKTKDSRIKTREQLKNAVDFMKDVMEHREENHKKYLEMIQNKDC